ncbi:MAG: Nif3-like dinuclear metal center hexameric protein, partial [Desulfobulbaceae bacterium]|nr:Nif3-like dinuclear metal center hexameric protein [Desulfobulbaceae bacterium]
MSVTVQNLIDIVEKIAPHNLAESWDNVGLLIGSPKNNVHSLILGLDPTLALLDEAIARGADLIITHHPIIFHPLKTLLTEQPIGRFIQRAVSRGISV